MFIFGLISQIYIFGGIGFLSPTFTLHMVNNYEGFDEFWVGIYFAMPAVSYIINTLLVPIYCSKFSRKYVLLAGSCLFCLSIYMIGTSPFLGFPDSPKTIFMGSMLLGFSACMVTIPILPEMLHRIELDLPELKGDELNNVASGYFNSFLGVGETLGPISASLLTETYGFRVAFDVLATLIMAYCMCYMIYINESDSVRAIKNFVYNILVLKGKNETGQLKRANSTAVKNDESQDEIIQ